MPASCPPALPRRVVQRLQHPWSCLLRHHPRHRPGQAGGAGKTASQLLYFSLRRYDGEEIISSSFQTFHQVITTWVINLAPVGVFFLIGGQVSNTNCTPGTLGLPCCQVLGMGDFQTVLIQLGWYFTTVLMGNLDFTQIIFS